MKAKSNTVVMTEEEIDAFLREQRVGTLCLGDGQSSYGVPLAYFYGDKVIYLTLGPGGRKAGYVEKNKNVCFAVHWLHPDYGKGKRSWKSVICDGTLERVTNPDEIVGAGRAAEKHMGMPQGAFDPILQMTLKNPATSNFWRINITKRGGKGVVDFEETFEEE